MKKDVRRRINKELYNILNDLTDKYKTNIVYTDLFKWRKLMIAKRSCPICNNNDIKEIYSFNYLNNEKNKWNS
ncbi:hypothetical protein OFT50_15285 [Brachyspira hyodysenteriae]|nr:hypothetical protein [Brachyspira hyodysenteriae]MDA0073423.1 hypothetical protein [Brachyspira hyodysenteriae]